MRGVPDLVGGVDHLHNTFLFFLVIKSRRSSLTRSTITPVRSAPEWCWTTPASLEDGKRNGCPSREVRLSSIVPVRGILADLLLVMSEGTLLPDGRVLIINGARTGTAGPSWFWVHFFDVFLHKRTGYDNLQNRVGNSNADHPCFTPLLYDPNAPVGSRFSRVGLPTSDIPRMYHSVAYVASSSMSR